MKNHPPSSVARTETSSFSGCIPSWALAFAALAVGCSAAHAAVVYNETGSGDFSGTGTAPTLVAGLGAGSNEIRGATGNPGSTSTTTDRDYFTFSVPAGLEWYGLTDLGGMDVGRVAFLGLQAGSQVTLLPSTMTAAGLLGWHHYSSSDANKDLLPLMATSANSSSGFSIPLGAGDYSIWIQDSTPGVTSYSLNFQLRSVPDSGPGLGLAAALLGLVMFLRQRIRSET